MTGCYLLQNPCDAYAFRVMERIYERFGYRPICFFTDREARIDANREQIEAHRLVVSVHDVALGQLLPFVESLRRRYWLMGAIPYSEDTLGAATLVNHHLGVGRNSLEVMRRFRDKGALKEHLRSVDPRLRINRSCIVRGPSEARRHGARCERYVLKPNDGFGNRTIGVFDKRTTEAELTTYFQRVGKASVLLEEYVGGKEYFINGQVDAHGEVYVFAIFAYDRVRANGRENIDYLTSQVKTSDPEFATLQAYASRVMRASDLVRSPFHMEVKVDDSGPCLIEVGARLVGNGNAFVTNLLHKGSLDVFDLAVDGYLGAGLAKPRCDWESYDETSTLYVHGIAHKRELICTLRGVEEVEALPEFHSWVGRPHVGDVVGPTVDLFTSPYTVLLRGKDRAQLRVASERVRALLRWNTEVTVGKRLETELLRLPKRVQRRAERFLYAQRAAALKDAYA